MKRLMMLDQRGTILLSDILNQRIIKELVLYPLSSTDLSRRLGMPQVKVWRRITKLVEAGIVEQRRLEHTRNFEKKFFRASALRYVPFQQLDFEPKGRLLKDAYKTYLELQQESIRNTMASNEIPKDAENNPVEYGVYADLSEFCRIMLDPKTQPRLERLQQQLVECKKDFEFLT
jgi:DNA-binding Lrp family transcriptional regulator